MDENVIGTIWRDTYGDKRRRNLRTVKLVERLPDGRWMAEALTRVDGAPFGDGNRGRFSKLSEKTLRSHYERVSATKAE